MLPTNPDDFSNPHSDKTLSEADLMDVTRRDKTLWGVQDIDCTKIVCLDVLHAELNQAAGLHRGRRALIKCIENDTNDTAHKESFFFMSCGASESVWKAWCEYKSPQRRIYLTRLGGMPVVKKKDPNKISKDPGGVQNKNFGCGASLSR